MIGRIVFGLMLAAIVAALLFGYGVYTRRIVVPERYDPFTPFDVRAPDGPFALYKRWRTLRDPQLCSIALEHSGLVYRPMADATGAGGCALKDVVRVTQAGDTRFSAPFLATCPLALGIAEFERRTFQPAALDMFGERVTRIEHVGSYACRNVNHQKDTALSQHASANAIDLTGFVLADGTRITLEQWAGANARDASFLRRVHEGACRSFATTLGPDYNALHATHFHVDMGPTSICR
ncbi:extensin-like protein [Candidatus Burkholderia verschuerenii]|uniref:Extensin-like protein n=1 Tax=Candidatus Burkholderia verschuerenii TaxID=242163 RepID=A0A0L0M916_9BURK|nr:extensin family protein [Candidatus Burkholderia verschuerenii]KND59142.1 extensin-like protein [Candidatus Burkholderia verschuerenii]